MNDFLSFLENKIKKNIEVEKILIVDNSKKYRLLCLEHIKIFNKKWNYFSDMSDQEVEFFVALCQVKSDLTKYSTC